MDMEQLSDHKLTTPSGMGLLVCGAGSHPSYHLGVWCGKKDVLPLPWFSGLAILLELVESTGTWPQGLLDAYIAMVPKADGDSTPLGQRSLSVLPVVYRLWASLRLGHSREWVEGWLPKSVYSLGMVFPRLRPGSLLPWILRRFFLALVVISCMLWLLMLLNPLVLLTDLFWTVLWVDLGYLTGFVRFIFLSIVMFG